MKRKIIFLVFLLIGVISVIGYIFNSCTTEGDYVLRCNFTFLNETDYVIRYSRLTPANKDTSLLFEIEPNSVYLLQLEGESGKDPAVEDAGAGLLGDFNGGSILVEFDDSKYVIYDENEGSNYIYNYEAQTLSERYFQYSYRFTNEIFDQAIANK